ncbi:c-type cytochrome [Allopontixanthobacter sp.]|uniref:c-type cytochrome n=1 Tax=Allopontixanthobacter sp. TaxID=2906452 RepID=UPI002AB847DD|nr:c-type cytochrome [Allopontixanthobacter sp.]MDZ4306945.1 c-type cytochrome [Allopontixanthobacter sp.]
MKDAAFLLLATGAIAMLAAPAVISAQTSGAAQPVSGERAFQKCYACHSLDEQEVGAQGPSLNEIVGRAVAAEPGYPYSLAMRNYARRQPRWTRAALDAFLTNPQEVVPENDMGFFGISDPAERAALIDYLAAH